MLSMFILIGHDESDKFNLIHLQLELYQGTSRS